MNGMLTTDYPFKRSARAVTMTSSVKIADDQVQVDPQLLFQRLIIACDNSQLEELVQYELCTYPTALFNSKAATKGSTSRCSMDKAYTRDQDAALKECTVRAGRRCSSPSTPMAKRFSDLRSTARLVLHLRAKEKRKSNSDF